MKKQIIISIILFLGLHVAAQNKTYYLNHNGNDANDGLSTASAWLTFSNVNNTNFKPGDKILLEGGQNFTGTIQIDAGDSGTSANPVTIRSYGNGKATINAVDTPGISLSNASGILISNLIIMGDGSDHNGIDVSISQTNAAIESISMDSIDVSGFGGRGCLIGAKNTDKGINHLTVRHSSFHDNAIAGLETYGNWPALSNTDFTISYCRFYNNYGKLTETHKATGSGIVVSGVDGGTIEYSEAYNNGINNRSTGGGPVGIWAYDAKNIVFQYCESHHNKAGLTADGGGFDLDGGSQYCTIQYCYSHDNEGYGMALVEYGSPNQFTGNIIRYNISQNDGRKNSYGAIALYAVDGSHQVRNSEIYNNTVYVDANNLTDGRPCAVHILTQNYSGVNIRNNIFFVSSGVDMMNSETGLSASQVFFGANNYYSSTAQYDFFWGGNHYTSFDQWKTASGEETNMGSTLAIIQNPLLMNAGSGGTIKPAEGGTFSALVGYSLTSFSPLVDKAITLSNMGPHDFFGNTTPISSGYDIGASEAVPPVVLPLTIISFSGTAKENELQLRWRVANEEQLYEYEIQKSIDGASFITIGSVAAKGQSEYHFTDDQWKMSNAYYRLVYVYSNGKSGFSPIIKFPDSFAKPIRAFYRSGEGIDVQVYCHENQNALICVYASDGSLMYRSRYPLSQGCNSILIKDAATWRNGVYVIQAVTDRLSTIKLVK